MDRRNVEMDYCPGVGEEGQVFIEEVFGCYEVVGVEVGFSENKKVERGAGWCWLRGRGRWKSGKSRGEVRMFSGGHLILVLIKGGVCGKVLFP